ncbi:2'-5' RNA ligase family protein [Mucilaginibacter sp. Bleaf8]|uniref:2'-5' RNA ligase family protein n=1 Tax=Mucilaginibacter sp. Bleaf8 TaxID=2834430 RepID=UPI001BCB91F6|nr:2'-5' RNA ligase family protein [Mucilaginibacter sp. Bleaf8]MBS7565257.1 2'-5' RNA ligase family protein [Mucilaginibacter sp. Bleaf8]
MTDAPLILTLVLDKESQSFFNALRKQYFPPERNYLDAHLTLFHHLPAHEQQIINDIKECGKQTAPLALQVTDVVSIGNGVAYKLENMPLMTRHKRLQQQWQQWLIPQDRQKLWPHITIQNKVSPDQAKSLQAQIKQEFVPFVAQGFGLSLWAYKGGPWEFVKYFEFTGNGGGTNQ